MEYFNFDKCYFKNNIICCELVNKIKQYINILQFETNRLSTLQLECNQLLDKFYSLKDEFDFLLREIVPIKYLSQDDTLLTEEYINEFSIFIKSIWQMGKNKFSEKGRKTQYMCFVGSPLSEVMSTIQSFVEEVMVRLTYMPYHSDCASTMHSICSQICAELQNDGLGAADACLRQYIYLQGAIPFLQELNNLINQHILLPDIHTPKQFVDKVILRIPPISKFIYKVDTEDFIPFRYVVELLNGKLLHDEFLDHNSEIRPVVEDDINLKRSIIVMKAVEWILQKHKKLQVSKILKDPLSPLRHVDMVERNKNYSDINFFGSPFCSRSSHILGYTTYAEPVDMVESLEAIKFDWSGVYGSPLNTRKLSRRGRKTGPSNSGIMTSNDLQPIKLHTLQTPLLPPLL